MFDDNWKHLKFIQTELNEAFLVYYFLAFLPESNTYDL